MRNVVGCIIRFGEPAITTIEQRTWADVYVRKDRARGEIERAALFFVPRFYELADRNGMSANLLAGVGATLKAKFPDRLFAGRNALTIVHHGDEPASYKAALGSINVINDILGPSDRLSTDDIVACVFRLRDGPDIRDALGTDFSEVFMKSILSPEIIDAAFSRHRMPYNDAHLIWKCLFEYKTKNRRSLSDIRALDHEESHLIVVDNRPDHPRQIMKTSGRDVELGLADSKPVYNRNNVSAAPRKGHKWALDD